MRIQLFVLALATPIYLFAPFNPSAMAQAGSTGGTIGKKDKSVSGSEETATRKTQPAPGKSNSSGCGNVVGTYKWYLGVTTVINANGTATNLSNHGKWTCTGGQVTITWVSGHVDHLTPTTTGYSVIDNRVGQFEATRM
jgi:hypothetical protein